MSFFNMKNICSIPVPSTFPSCNVYFKARHSKLPFHTSNISSKHIFDLIHVDTWGPYNTPTHDDLNYFLTIIDDYSRRTWTFLLSTKSNVFNTLKNFLSMIKIKFNTKVKILRSDNALELGTSAEATRFLDSKGIIHQTSCFSSLHQNDVVERKHVHLLETCRSLLFQSHFPIKLWEECLLTATFFIKKYPPRILQ